MSKTVRETRITVTRDAQELWSAVVPLPLELGRQESSDPAPYELRDLRTHHRVAITPESDREVPRQVIRLQVEANGKLFVRNLHRLRTFLIGEEQTPLPPGGTFEIAQDTFIVVTARYTVGIQLIRPISRASVGSPMQDSQYSESLRTMNTVHLDEDEDCFPQLGSLLRESSSGEPGRLAVSMVKQALSVVQKAAGSDEFFQAAIQSAAKMVDLDHTYILLRHDDDWIVQSTYARKKDKTWTNNDGEQTKSLPPGCAKLLDRLLEDRGTIVFEPDSYMQSIGSSMMMLDRAVASPMLDHENQIIGAIYGDRRLDSDSPDMPIGDLEASLIEVMAAAVASGIAREQQELARRREAELRLSMNQFFSPSVLERLHADEGLLQGRDAIVTVLFCDIRGFSGVSEKVGPKRTIEWINDILTELSLCVQETDGVLVDYIGDEVMAMWGAPADQPNHASLACQAALSMLKKVDLLRERWISITPDRFGIGIGINTGEARVGNTGSRIKFKYGPLGNTVNVASRVQGMTKKFGVAALVTESTQEAVRNSGDSNVIAFRRIAEVRPVGVQTHFRIHQLASQSSGSWYELKERYEDALSKFYDGSFTQAASILVSLMETHPDDTPSIMLLQRVVDAIVKDDEDLDRIVQLSSK